MPSTLCLRLTVFLAASLATFAIPYDEYILAPPSRTLHPVSVRKVNGTVIHAESITGPRHGKATFKGSSAVTFDYGKNVAGVVSLNIGDISDKHQFIGITFSESSLWISGKGSDATADAGIDETLWIQPKKPGTYTVPRQNERGAFRYLSLVHNTTGSLEVTQVTTHFTAMPHYAEDKLRDYTGYFHSNDLDELLNRIWYAGAYTNQLCTIDPKHGDALIYLGIVNSTQPGDSIGALPWYFNYTITNGTSALVDGAKRDRLVWAGDMSIAVPGIVTSTNDLISVQNSINSLFAIQNKTSGQLPYAGRPFFDELSHTYHLYTLIGVADYYLYSDDIDYLQSMWDDIKLAMNFALGFIDDSGLMNVTSPNDWLRFGMGGHNIEANAILYQTLNQVSVLAGALNETDLLASWAQTAATIKSSANELLWDASAGMYRDNETTTLHPQDGNAWAVVSNLTLNDTQTASISQNLVERWTPYGAPAPEAADAISPFISGFELQAHILSGNASAALDLMRLEWGFMLDDPRMTNSTFIEGYSSTGALHYAPYTNDPRVSHAHGWSTGPTSTLTFMVAGIQLTSAGGRTWLIKPTLGDLTRAEAGFKTSLGSFSVNNAKDAKTGSFQVAFETPKGTNGALSVEYPDCDGTLVLSRAGKKHAVLHVKQDDAPQGRIEVDGLEGGQWTARFTCSS
ncbi:bacterial alpha-L-rhamnosidase domain-containing protein [Punctularia strigosozonata HHB-11173 SS5]|uniref:bacterial alpha-L-rhamnosidase domain-containing protein n=1 Tax=Punctularia strigosozonata (strain HHB-11173) TaxID=741275 RepID=UPI00044170BF|nr:bacterial alpha-L-rhamnosidase domain-containing protein [Punctularia strigosozonata HHB-11173 SS5]EIN05956.1 bacterial alpha-L-rhamnosidase domain-containing protein [Punctularia strigosozonata HHB-11173 SS5]